MVAIAPTTAAPIINPITPNANNSKKRLVSRSFSGTEPVCANAIAEIIKKKSNMNSLKNLISI